jgi:hypothetical protein
MAEHNSGDAMLEDSPSEVEEFLRDAVEMDDVQDPNLGDVQAEPGEVVAVIDGVEIRHLPDESGHVLPVEDESGEVIGEDSFPESELGVESGDDR